MRRNPFFIILIVLGAISLLADLAFIVYLGVTISSVLGGLSFLPTAFSTLCLALVVVNAVAIAYAILYLLVLRK